MIRKHTRGTILLFFSFFLYLFLSIFQLSLHHGPSRLSTYTPLNVPGPAINHWFPTASHALPPICQHLMRHTTSCNPLCTNNPLALNNLAFSAIEGWLKDIAPEGDWPEGPGKNCKSIQAPWERKRDPLFPPLQSESDLERAKATDPEWMSFTEIARPPACGGTELKEVPCC